MTLQEQMQARLGYEYKQGDDVQERKIELLINQAMALACSITKYKTLPPTFEPYILEAAMLGYRKLGKEGITSENMTGYSANYGDDMTAYLSKHLGKRKNAGTL